MSGDPLLQEIRANYRVLMSTRDISAYSFALRLIIECLVKKVYGVDLNEELRSTRR